jgi:hypothetical protein
MSDFEENLIQFPKNKKKSLQYLLTIVFLQTIRGNNLKNILFLMKF